jgi:hypothetical protein
MDANVVSIGVNVAHPFLMDDPSIPHGVILHRCNKEFMASCLCLIFGLEN